MENNETVKSMLMTYHVEHGDFTRAGEASSKIKGKLLQLGFPGPIIRRVAIAAYEAEMNIVIHSLGGTIQAEIKPGLVSLIATDKGPGIPDVEQAMQEGFSTAPDRIREMGFGAGMGLPNMRNCSSNFEISSSQGIGTTIKMVIK